METVSDLLIWKYALYVFESICLLLFRKDLMLTQVKPYCNQAPHTIFKIKCGELYFKEMWKHKISWKWCISFAFIWCWEIMCQNVNLFEWIQWYYWHENQMLTYLNEFNSINESNSIKGNLRLKKKLSSNERAWKMQKKEPSPTLMCQMVPEIFHFKVRNLGKINIAIL